MLAGMSRSRVAFVVTLSAAGALSCAEPPLRANPPGPELPRPDAAAPDAAAPEGEEPAAPEPARVDDAAAPVEPGVLNPRDAENRTVFRDNGERCYVELPFPPLKPGEQRQRATDPKRRLSRRDPGPGVRRVSRRRAGAAAVGRVHLLRDGQSSATAAPGAVPEAIVTAPAPGDLDTIRRERIVSA